MPPVKQSDITVPIRDYFDERLKAHEKKLQDVADGLTQLAKDIIRRDKFDDLCNDLASIKTDLIKRIDEIEKRVSIIEAERKIEQGQKRVAFLLSDKIWIIISAVIISLIIKYL